MLKVSGWFEADARLLNTRRKRQLLNAAIGADEPHTVLESRQRVDCLRGRCSLPGGKEQGKRADVGKGGGR